MNVLKVQILKKKHFADIIIWWKCNRNSRFYCLQPRKRMYAQNLNTEISVSVYSLKKRAWVIGKCEVQCTHQSLQPAWYSTWTSRVWSLGEPCCTPFKIRITRLANGDVWAVFCSDVNLPVNGSSEKLVEFLWNKKTENVVCGPGTKYGTTACWYLGAHFIGCSFKFTFLAA